MYFTTLETERLLLRMTGPEEYEAIFRQPDEAIITLLGLDSYEALEKEKERQWKGRTTFNKSFRYFFLCTKSTGQTIGWCGYHTWYLDHFRAELGYGLFVEEYKRQGLMSEAMPVVLQHGFREMNLHRIEAMASPANEPSVKLLLNFGFTAEGLLREHYLKDGVYEDSQVFGLLRSEYENKKE